jgi:hypothetical protein
MIGIRWGTLVRTVAGATLVLTLNGCSDAGAPAGETIPDAEAADIGEAVGDEGDLAVAAVEPIARGCATVDDLTDTDQDGAPDEATFTYSLPACHFTGFRGGTLDVTGVIVLSDPTPSAPDFTYEATLEDFTWSFTAPGGVRSYAATRNGTRVLTGNAAGLSLSNTITVTRSYPLRAPATVSHNLLLQFTPATGETLERGQPLPDGTLVESGTLTWSRGGRSRTFTVSTVSPLVWDASCTTDRKIASGEIRLTLADGGYVRVVWTGCGEDPERSFVG